MTVPRRDRHTAGLSRDRESTRRHLFAMLTCRRHLFALLACWISEAEWNEIAIVSRCVQIEDTQARAYCASCASDRTLAGFSPPLFAHVHNPHLFLSSPLCHTLLIRVFARTWCVCARVLGFVCACMCCVHFLPSRVCVHVWFVCAEVCILRACVFVCVPSTIFLFCYLLSQHEDLQDHLDCLIPLKMPMMGVDLGPVKYLNNAILCEVI